MPRHFFDATLTRLGWIEGTNFIIERRFAGTRGEKMPEAVAALVAWQPDVIVAMGTSDAKPLLAGTQAIPIVVVTAGNPVSQGLAVSLARPGGMVTGTSAVTDELAPKLLEMAHELVPGAVRVSVLGDPRVNVPFPPKVGETIGVTVVSRNVSTVDDLDAAFAAAAAARDQAMVVRFSALTFEERSRITELAARFRMPAAYQLREYVEAGGLISYGPATRYNFERAAVLVDKILRGAKPADLPIEEPTKIELVVNLKAAKEIGLSVPQSVLARADDVIE